MSRISRTYGLSMFEIAASNLAVSLIIRAALNCASSIANDSTSAHQNGGTRSRVLIESPGRRTFSFVGAGHRESLIFAAFKVLIAFSRLPLSLRSRRAHHFCRGLVNRMFDREIY